MPCWIGWPVLTRLCVVCHICLLFAPFVSAVQRGFVSACLYYALTDPHGYIGTERYVHVTKVRCAMCDVCCAWNTVSCSGGFASCDSILAVVAAVCARHHTCIGGGHQPDHDAEQDDHGTRVSSLGGLLHDWRRLPAGLVHAWWACDVVAGPRIQPHASL